MTIAVKQSGIAKGALTGKVAIVTGSTSGIGLGVARALAAVGAGVVLNGFGKADEIDKAQKDIALEYKVPVSYSPADMSKPDAIKEMIDVALGKHGSIDILVNN